MVAAHKYIEVGAENRQRAWKMMGSVGRTG